MEIEPKIELYDPPKSTVPVKVSQKQSGEISFKIPPNKCCKVRIPYNPPQVKKPNVSVIVSSNSGSPYDMKHMISNYDVSGFTVHVLNKDKINEISGIITYEISPK